MPTYEFRCDACGCKFEVRQGYNDKALVRCPKCKTPCRRLIATGKMGRPTKERYGV